MRFDLSTWYETDVSVTLALMESFVQVVEQQAKESVPMYERYKQTYVQEDDEYSFEVEHYQGLDSLTVDLKNTFEVYFPSLQRRSAFLSVWAMFENELSKLCDRYKAERRLLLAVSDLQGKGIEQSLSYLEKVAGIKVDKTSSEWNRITKLRNLRNVIVHRDGSLGQASSGQVKQTLNYIEETALLSNLNNEVGVNEGFLAEVSKTFLTFFQSIGLAIKAEQQSFDQNATTSSLPTTIPKRKT